MTQQQANEDFDLEDGQATEVPTDPKVVRESLAELMALFHRKQDAAEVYKAGVFAVSVKAGYSTRAINALVKAECGDKARKAKHDADEVSELIQEAGRQQQLEAV